MLFVQKTHEEVLRGCVPDAPWVLDKQPAWTIARGQATKVMYVDNFAVIAEARTVAQPGLEAMLEALSSHGIAAASEDQPPLQADFLGFRLDCRKKTWRLRPQKFWVLTRALEATQKQGFRCTGREVERLLGHIVHAFMLRRELLALLHATYGFVQASYLVRQTLWHSVVLELGRCLALLPVVVAKLDRPWSERAFAFDASPWGIGDCEASWPVADVASCRGVRECWRFKLDLEGPSA